MLGLNDTSTLIGHFVSSPREREKRDSRRIEREEQGRKRNRNEREETEGIKTSPLYLYQPCPTVSQYQLDAPVHRKLSIGFQQVRQITCLLRGSSGQMTRIIEHGVVVANANNDPEQPHNLICLWYILTYPTVLSTPN